MNNLNQQHIGSNPVNHSPLEPWPGGAVAFPLAIQSFIAKPLYGPQSKWPRDSGNVFPFAGYPDKCGDFDEKNKLLLNYNKLQHAFNMYHFQRNKKIMNFTFFINKLSA
ncbi:MAG: hypothetical protein Q8P42_08625 [Gallionella sp.]|nr:hypothetical protein [Gallionella sp.]